MCRDLPTVTPPHIFLTPEECKRKCNNCNVTSTARFSPWPYGEAVLVLECTCGTSTFSTIKMVRGDHK